MYDKNKQNLLGMIEAVEKIISFTAEIKGHEELNKNQIIFDAVMMNFIVIGEAVSRLTDSFTSDNSHIDWSKIKGLRNIIAHDYFGIDAEEIWQIIKNIIPEFEQQIKKI